MATNAAQTMPAVEMAVRAARRGWRILPVYGLRQVANGLACQCGEADCKSPGKHPRISEWQKQATTETEQVYRWANTKGWAGTNWGVATGAGSDILVVDIDPRHNGMESLAEFWGIYGTPDDTLTVETGSGGFHFYYKLPASGEYRNKAGVAGLSGIDIRANNGFVVLPPALHISGNHYRWANKLDLAELPPNMAALLAEPTRPAFVEPAPAILAGNALRWLDKALERAAPGNRHDTLVWLACQLRDDKISDDEIYRVAYAYAGQVSREGDIFSEREADKVVDSVLRTPARAPAISPERLAAHTARVVQFPTYPQAYEDKSSAKKSFRRTEQGNSDRLVDRFGSCLRFCPSWNSWLVWDGKRWKRDDLEAVYLYAKEIVKDLFRECAEYDGEERADAYKWACKNDTVAGIRAMVKLAESTLAISPAALDSDIYLTNLANGTLDLRTGELREHKPDDLITKVASVAYDPKATAPTWESFIRWATGNRATLIAFLRRSLGYALSGDTTAEAFFLLYGVGANGKSTIVETMRRLLGDYAVKMPASALMAGGPQTSANPEIARLFGARFAYASEGDDGARLAEGMVKELTSNETITARFLYSDPFDFFPTFKVYFSTNHAPIVRDTSAGMWRRIKRIPFDARLADDNEDPTDDRPRKDLRLKGKLVSEFPGILNWLIAGFQDWQTNGLGTAKEVDDATAAYREEMDDFKRFIDEACVLAQNTQSRAKSLYLAYSEWADDNGFKPVSATKFGTKLSERAQELAISRTKDYKGWVWVGIGLRASDYES